MVRAYYNIVFELFVRHSSGSVERLRYRKNPVACVSWIWAIHISVSADIWDLDPIPPPDDIQPTLWSGPSPLLLTVS